MIAGPGGRPGGRDMREHEFKHPNYWLIWAVLLVMTVLEVGLTFVPFFQEPGNKGKLIALLLVAAVAKAGLVALYFMHLRFEWARGRIIYLLACAPFVLVVVFTYGLLPDIGGVARFLIF